MTKAKRGLSLVEVLIGLGIAGFICLSFLLFLRSSRQEVDFNSDYLTAMMISQKIREGITQEATVNPDFHKLFSPAMDAPVQDLIPFFGHLEDFRPADGIVDEVSPGNNSPQVDGFLSGIKDFRANIRADRMAVPASSRNDVVRITCLITWGKKIGNAQMKSEWDVFSPVPPKRFVPQVELVDVHISRMAGKMFFDVYHPLEELAATKGFDLATVFAWGKLLTLGDLFFGSGIFRGSRQAIDARELIRKDLPAGEGSKIASETIWIVDRYHDIAKGALEIMVCATGSLGLVRNNFSATTLGPQLWAERNTRLQVCAQSMGELSQTFRKALAKEAGEILTLFSSGVMNSISARRRQALALRIMEIIRIKKLQPNLDLGGKTVEQAFGILEKAAQGRMIPLSRLIILEKSLQSGSTANLLAARPELGVISSMLSEFASFEQFVQTQHLVASP